MNQRRIKKLATLQSEIDALKIKAEAIETIMVQEIIAIFRDNDAFSLDFDALIGGILGVINNVKDNTSEVEKWCQIGRKFRRKRRRTL
ncbi:MAG: hypothetical protein WCG04_03480 [Alphaproteobacteria bacterium]